MDKIEELLKDPKTDLQKQALTDTSYKNIDRSFSDYDTNFELATYGDAVLKLALCKIYRDRKNAGIKFSDNLSKWKEKHESNEVLVRVVAKHYKLLKFLKYDKKGNGKPTANSTAISAKRISCRQWTFSMALNRRWMHSAAKMPVIKDSTGTRYRRHWSHAPSNRYALNSTMLPVWPLANTLPLQR